MDSKIIYLAEYPVLVKTGMGNVNLIGFNVDYEFALKARKFKLSNEFYDLFQKKGRGIIAKQGFGKNCIIKTPYFFEEDSLMVKGVVVPGNACDMALTERFMNRCSIQHLESAFEHKKRSNLEFFMGVDYMQHNIDNEKQALGLIRLLTNWADWASEIID